MPPKTGRAAVDIVGDVSNFGADVERDLNKELRSVKVDVRGVAKDLSTGIEKGVADAGKSFDGLSVKAKETLADVGEEAEQAGLKIGAGVSKGTDRARDELGRFIKTGSSASSGFTAKFVGITGILGGIGKAAGTAFSLAFKGAALAATANTVAQIVVALAPIAGAVGILPAVFIAAKIAAGTFKIAMMGVADAVGAGLTGDTEAFNEALKLMPPAAQAAMKEIVGMKDQLLNVRAVVQQNFFAPLIGQLKPLGAVYLPMITKQLGSIATGFGTAAASTIKFLQMPTSVKSVNNALTDTTTAVNEITAGIPGIIRAFLPLWEVGASFLPGLTAEFGSLTQRIGAFMENAQKTGQLKEFISGGLSALGELGSILADVGSILSSVFQAASASGTGLLGVIGQAVGQFAAFLKTAEGASALTSIFQVLGQVAGIFGQALGLVLPIVAQLVTVLAGALQPVLPVISSLIQQLAPVVAQVGEALGAILGPAIGVVAQLLATLVPVLLPIVSIFISQLLPVIMQLMPVITQLGTTISTILVAALQALAPVFSQLLPVISEILTAVLIPLIPVIAQVGQLFLAMMPALTPLIALLVQLLVMALKPFSLTVPLIVEALGWLINAMTAFIGPVAAAIGWVANFITHLLQTRTVAGNAIQAWNWMKSTVSAVFGFIRTYVVGTWNTIKSVTSAVWGFIRSYITGQVNMVKAVLNGIGAAVSAVIGFFNNMRTRASSALSSMRAAVSAAVTAVIGFFARMVTGAADKISNLISTVRGIGGRIKSAVGNLASLLVSAGRNVIQGLINGISDKLGALKAKAASAASAIRNLFPFSPAKEGPLSGKGSPEIAGRKIVQMIAGGMERRIPEIRDAATKIADATQGPASGHGKDKSRGGTRKRIEDSLRKIFPNSPTIPGGSGGSGGGDSGGAVQVVFGTGSITLNFYGMAPGQEQAYAAGRAAGQGLAAAFAASDVRTTVRTI